MTREEAIEILQGAIKKPNTKDGYLGQAIDMAIQALSQEPCDDAEQIDYHDDFETASRKIHDYKERQKQNDKRCGNCKLIGTDICYMVCGGSKSLYKPKQKLEPCDDAISRILKRMWNCRGKHTTSIDKVAMEQIIRDELFSVTPKPIECDDAISREAVCKMICAEFVNPQDGMQEWRNAVNDVVENILHKVEQLPSVTQKSGKWIGVNPMVDTLMCSECGENIISADFKSNYCPNCGAKMESEDK